ncbi:unnamed protein product [Caenorhabditis brenneri]
MDSTLSPFFKAMLTILNNSAAGPIPDVNNPAAIENPIALPIIPADGIPFINRKADKEAERRDKTNIRFTEFQELVAPDSNGKMSQANILKAALDTVVKIKRETNTNPRVHGLNEAIERMERLTLHYLNSLKLTETDYVQTLKEMLEMFRDILIPGRPTTTLTPSNSSATFTPPTIAFVDNEGGNDANKTRKAVKKHREQCRRNNQADGFGLLRQFIAENNIVPNGTQKLQVLETIIAFIRNSRASPVDQPVHHDPAQYQIGFEQGKHLAKNVITAFFKSIAHLRTEIDALHSFMGSQLGPLGSSIKSNDIKLDQVALRKFLTCYPTLFINRPSFWRPWE